MQDPKTSCDFEDPDLCGWTHDPRQDFEWRRHQFSTPSGHVGTGPSFDHTFGEGKGGFYLYGEASSPRKVNDTSRLFSPVYPYYLSGGCFVFWYHMYGSTIGGLRVYLKPEGFLFGEFLPDWEKWGNQGNQWLRGNLSIPEFKENFQIIIEGVRGTSYIGDTAIDDVLLTTADCDSLGNVTQPTAEWMADSCRGRCREPNDAHSCGCTESCYEAANCCGDYMTMCLGNTEAVESDIPEEWAATNVSSTHSSSRLPEATTTLIPHVSTNIPLTSTSSSVSTPSTALASSPTQITSSTQTTGTVMLAHSTQAASATLSTSSIQTTSTTHSTSSTQTTSTTQSTSSKQTTNTTQSTSSTPTTTPGTSPNWPTGGEPEISTTTLKTIQLSTMSRLITSPLSQGTVSAAQPKSEEITTNKSALTFASVTTPVPTVESTTESTRKTYNLRPRTQRTSTPVTQTFSTTPIIANSTTERKDSSFSYPSFQSSQETQKEFSKASVSPETYTTQKELNDYNITMPKASSGTPLFTTVSILEPTSKAETIRSTVRTTLISITPKTSTTILPSTTPSTTSQNFEIATSTISSIIQLITGTPTHTTSRRKFFIPSTIRGISFPRTSSVVTTVTTIDRTHPTIRTILSTYVQRKMTEPTVETTSEQFYTHASKAASTASDNSKPTVTIISVTIVIVLCLAGGIIYYLRKRKIRKQSKLSDDSEMRFLSDNEIIEYSDASFLDKMNT
ncbi:mucin-5AC-like [Stegodyphus dumicola]|uniref:mucin-5AC-like n=1 Tax=Stegodyphus dumicola TaxID=202533 RepID=UPI0015A97C25|nr:mucin-5AC-like [Stegodyphus dumicola]